VTLYVPTYRVIDVPVHGNPSEVDQMEIEIDAPPELTDEDVPNWLDDFGYPGETPYPADLVLPVIDYDPPDFYEIPHV
jgi:hypothetical protein